MKKLFVVLLLGLLSTSVCYSGETLTTQQNSEVEKYIHDLKYGTIEDREHAASLLGGIGESAVPALIQVLKFGDTYAKENAARALGYIGLSAKDAVPDLLGVLKNNDIDGSVRSRAALALYYIAPSEKDEISDLIKLLKDKDDFVKGLALTALGRVGPAAKDAVPDLIEALKNRDVVKRMTAAEVLSKIGPEAKDAIPALIKTLRDENRNVRSFSADALGNIGLIAKDAIPALLEALKDKSFSAAAALHKIDSATKDSIVIPILIEGLKSKDHNTRLDAAIYLGRVGPAARDAVPALIETLKGDEYYGNRMCIAQALGYIGDKSALEVLLYVAKNDSSGNVRDWAKKAIDEINTRNITENKK